MVKLNKNCVGCIFEFLRIFDKVRVQLSQIRKQLDFCMNHSNLHIFIVNFSFSMYKQLYSGIYI